MHLHQFPFWQLDDFLLVLNAYGGRDAIGWLPDVPLEETGLANSAFAQQENLAALPLLHLSSVSITSITSSYHIHPHSSSSFFPQGEAFSQLVELCRFGERDGDLGVNFPPALALDILFTDGLDGRVVVLGEDLGELEGQGDAFSHGFQLHSPVLLQD